MHRRVLMLLALAACSDPSSPAIDAPPGPEADCFDGLDDNHDLRVDCADPTCAAAAVCVDAAPPDWTGHAALYDGPEAGTPACPTVFAMTVAAGNAQLSAPPASCTACTCGPPAGGACVAGGGAPTVPPPTWGAIGRACTNAPDTATGCTGTACEPRPAAPFVAGTCVSHGGDVPCPSGPYANRHVFHRGVVDSRGCAPCICGAPNGGACPVSGGEPVGSAVESDATTYCCL